MRHPAFIGLKEMGETLLQRFKWGPCFYEVNEEVLEKYAACLTSAEVVTAQQQYLEKLERVHTAARLNGA